MKTVVSIPSDLFDEAERLAERLGLSRSALYTRALTEFLERRRREAITERLNEVYATQTSDLDSVLAEIQWASLDKSDW